MQYVFESFADVHHVIDRWPAADRHRAHSLEHMHTLLDFLGNPEKRLRVIHVAGTSGKTSTAYYTAALLKAAGKRVGLTVSPHIDEVNERVQIDLTPLPEAEFCQRFGAFLTHIDDCRVTPSYFELFVAFALTEFAYRQLDYVVVEVGVGGTTDGTNVFEDPRKICVITDIGLDHVKVLGDSLTEITAHKAGIIRPHNAVFCNRQSGEVLDVIRSQAAQRQADLHVLTAHDPAGYDFLPPFQQRNFSLSLAAVRFALQRDDAADLPEAAIAQAAQTSIPGRMETTEYGDKTVILDISHNEQKLHALFEGVHAKYPGQAIAALVRMPAYEHGLTRITTGLRELAKGVQYVIVTSLSEAGDGPDPSFDAKRIASLCQEAGIGQFVIVPDPKEAFKALRHRTEPVLVVTGSTYLLNHIRPLIKRR